MWSIALTSRICNGWLGRFLAPRLRAAGHVPIGLDVAPGANTHLVGSVADRAVVERTFTDYGIEAVVQWGKRGQAAAARRSENRG